MIGVFCFQEQGHNGFNVSWKLCLNSCSLRSLKSTRRPVNNFNLETSLVSKVLFGVGRIKSKSALRNAEYADWGIKFVPFSNCLRQKELLKVSVLQKIYLILE